MRSQALIEAQRRYRQSQKGKDAAKKASTKYKNTPKPPTPQKKKRPYKYRDRSKPLTYLGLDGEGQGKRDHRYLFLACSNKDGSRSWSVEHSDRLSTKACFDFLLALPRKHHRIFGFALNYDWTKILTDLDNKSLFYLFRPELRPNKKDPRKGPIPVRWKNYYLNLQGTKFSISKGKFSKLVIWDIFKFYGCKFVSALKDWKVGNKELHDRMTLMKDKRSEFDKVDKQAVRDYCLEETSCMADLAEKLVTAHDAVELPLTSFYGAGSSASAMLQKMGILEKLASPPSEMREAVSSAFFGGRFENSVIGPICERVWNYDISSAYPYQLFFLPCLLHGEWRLSKNRADLDRCKTALVRYKLGPSPETRWGPFPFREDDGSICFPIESGGGWVYKDEYLAGEKLFSNVQFIRAWIYECQCDCIPFKEISYYYLYRIKIGKEGPGIVIKLAVNSCYGKLAQSVGNAIFNNWLWAGLITSGTRAQILQVMALHHDISNLLMVATDGIYTRERVDVPKPNDTGTGLLLGDDNKIGNTINPKPLGGWEEKEVPKGVFVARPGIYFPMNPTEAELKDVRGRGVGKGVVLENWKRIVDSYEKHGVYRAVRVANVARFCGAKTTVSLSKKKYVRASPRTKGTFHDLPAYGQWITRPVEMGFDPMPKRSGVDPNGLTLTLRRLPLDMRSAPYHKAVRSQEAIELEESMVEILEQPDGDLVTY